MLDRALSRTLLLIRDELILGVPDNTLLDALTSTNVVLTGDAKNLAGYSAQTAYVTAALLMARSGHRVQLVAPDVPLTGPQPPLRGSNLLTALADAGSDLLPGIEFECGDPGGGAADLEIRFGDTATTGAAKRSISMNASRRTGAISALGSSWACRDAPLGALAAAGLGSVEAFKCAMRKLVGYAAHKENFLSRFAAVNDSTFRLAAEDEPEVTQLGRFDLVSAGAIANAFLYCLSRIPNVRGEGRVIDFDIGDVSNLNRNMLLLRSGITELKVDGLAKQLTDIVKIDPVSLRIDGQQLSRLSPLASRVLVGVDDIPTRWAVQSSQPDWLGIGATSHWSAMASFHTKHTACARCLHPADESNAGPIPTVAFVSYWAGLLLIVYFLESLVKPVDIAIQQTYFTPHRPESVWRIPIARRSDCPLCRNSP